MSEEDSNDIKDKKEQVVPIDYDIKTVKDEGNGNVDSKEPPVIVIDDDAGTVMNRHGDTNKTEKEVDDRVDIDEKKEEGVTTFSGYQPISQSMFDWEPPTSLDNEMRTEPPLNIRRGLDGEELVLTEAGEKIKPTPHIWEIKQRKFDKKPKKKLFVGGLIFEVTEDFLYEQFEKYGEIYDACIVTDKVTGMSRGFGYVTFMRQEDAEEAIKAIDGLIRHLRYWKSIHQAICWSTGAGCSKDG